MADEIASIWINTQLDLKGVYRDLDNLGKANTPTLKLKVDVEDSRLTELNKHLDKKVSHLKETQRYFDSNPLRVRVDDSALSSLNSKLSGLSNSINTVNVGVDAEDVYKEVINIKKEIQAQKFVIKPDIDTTGVTNKLEKALDNPNLNLNIRIKDTITAKGTESKEISIGLKNIEKSNREIVKNTANRGLIGNIVTGFQEKIGANINKQLTQGVRDVFGKEATTNVRKASRIVNKFVKKSFIDNEDFTQASNEVGEILGLRLRKAGYKIGDGIVAALENREGDISSKINLAIKTATEDVDFSNVTKELAEEFKSASGKLRGGLANESGLRKLTEPFGKQLSAYREIALQERAIPLVRQRAFEVLQQKRAKNSAKVVDENTKELIITTGGYAGARGLSGARIAQELNKQNVQGRQAIWVKNEDTDIPKESMSKAQDKLVALLTSMGKPNLRGYSKDALEIASQGLAAYERNPTITIKILGESGGGFAAEEASKILDMLGVKNEFLGVGTPNFIGALDTKDRKIISPDETLGAETNKLYKRLGLAKITSSQKILGVKGHPYENYRDAGVAELQNFMHGSPGKVTPELISDFKKGADFFKQQDKSKLDSRQVEQLSEAAYKNLQHIRRYLIVATDDTKNELQQIVNDFEDVFTELSPDGKDLSDIKVSINKAKEYLTYLEKQPGVEASIVAQNVAKELENVKKQLQATLSKTTGITEKQYNKALQETIKVQQQLLNPAIGLKLPIIKPVDIEPETITEPVKEVILIVEEIKTTLDDSFNDVKERVKNFQEAYQSIKAATTGKNQNKDFASVTAKTTLENVGRAKNYIENKRVEYGVGKIGSPNAEKINQLKGQLTQVENNIKRQLAKSKIPLPELDIKNIENVGKDVAKGLQIGIQQGREAVLVEVEKLSKDVVKEAKQELDIQSPSRVFEQIGKEVVAGFSQGLQGLNKITFTSFVENIKTKFTDLVSTGGKLGLFFVGFSKGLPLLRDFANASVNTAIEFESLGNQIKFASGNASDGIKNFETLRKQAKDLKVDLRSSIQGGVGVIASSKDTPLEGYGAELINQAIAQSSLVLSLTQEQQSRLTTAFQQMMGKGIRAEELKGQIGDVAPSLVSTAAREFAGGSTKELEKLMEKGQLGQEDVARFAQRIITETATGVSGSLDTTQAAMNNFNNSVTELQANTGKTFLPLQKLSLNILASSLETISNHMDKITNVLSFLSIWLSKPLWLPFIQGVVMANMSLTNLSSNSRVAMASLITNTGNAIKAIAPMAKQFAIFTIITTGIEQLKVKFTELSGEIGKSVDSQKVAITEYEKLLGRINSPSIKTKSNFDIGIERLKQFDFTGERTKTIKDTVNKIKISQKDTQKLLSDSSAIDVTQSVENVKRIDKELQATQIRRRAILQNNPNDVSGLRDVKLEETNLLKSRNEAIKPVAAFQKTLSSQTDNIKAQIDYLKNLKVTQPLYAEEVTQVDARIKLLEDDLSNVQKQQDKFNKSLGETTSAYTLMQKAIRSVADSLADANDITTLTSSKLKTNLINQVTKGNVTTGQEQFLSRQIDQAAMAKQLQLLQDALRQSQALLNTDDNRQRMQSFGINENTGRARLANLSENAKDTKDKYLFDELAALQEKRLQVADLQLQVATARQEAKRQLIEQTKQVAEYYKGIARQAELQSIEFKKLSNQINTTNQQNRLREALTNGYDNIVTQFVDGLIESMGQLNSISDRTLDAQSQLINNRNQFQDSLQSGLELKRSLPGSVPTIPVELDLSGLANNENVRDLQQQLSDASINSTNLDDTLNNVTESFNNAVDNANELTRNIDNSTESTAETFQQLNNVTLGLGSSNDAVKNLNAEFGVSNSHLSNAISNTGQWTQTLSPLESALVWIQNAFKGISDTISGLISQTTAWLSSLSQVGTILNTGISQIASQPVGETVNQISSGVGQVINDVKNNVMSWFQGGKKISPYKIVESVGGRIENVKRYEDLAKHHPSSGRESGRNYDTHDGHLEEVRQQGASRHVKKDFVLQQNGRQDVNVPSPASGYIRRRNDKWNTVQVVDNATNEIIASFLHMGKVLVNNNDKVVAGQTLGIQGDKGSPGAIHVHAEMEKTLFQAYIKALDTGNFSQIANTKKEPFDARLSPQAAKQVTAIEQSRNQISQGLTPLGQKYATLAQNPRVKAALEAIAIAEVGEALVKKGGGYGKQIGGNYGRDDFANPAALTSIPASLPGRGGQNAFGRYQIHQPDFKWAKDVLGVKNLSPQNQDIIGVQRLAFRGAIEPLLKGDMATFLKKAGNEFASLQGSKYAGDGLNATTVGGKANVFTRNFNNALSRFSQPINVQNATIRNQANPITIQNAAIRGQASPISQLQPTVDAANNIQREQYQRQQQLEQEREQADVKRQQQEYARNQERLLRQFKRGARDLEDSRRSGRQQVTDLASSVNKNPTRKESFSIESTSIARQYNSAILERERSITETQERIRSAEKALSTGEITGDAATALNKQLNADKKAVNELAAEIIRLRKLRKEAADAAFKLSQREEKIARQSASFEERAAEISALQARIDNNDKIALVQPYSDEAKAQPGLRQRIQLLQQDLDLEKDIFAINERRFKHELTDSEANRQIELAKKRNIALQEGIELDYKAATTEQDRKQKKRDLEAEIQTQNELTDSLKGQLELYTQQAQTNPYSPEALDIPYLQKEIALREANVALVRELADIDEKRFTTNATPGEAEASILAAKHKNEQTKETIRLTYENAKAEQVLKISRRSLEASSAQANISSQVVTSRLSQFDSQQSRSPFAYDNGTYSALQLKRFQAQNNVENFNLQTQIADAEELARVGQRSREETDLYIASLRQLNSISLNGLRDEINKSIGDNQINQLSKVKDNLQTVFDLTRTNSINLSNAKADAYLASGGNEFVANAIKRRTGRETEIQRRDQELRSLDISILSARAKGITIDDDAIARAKSDILAISELNLANLNNQFKTFSSNLTSIAQQGLQGLSSGLADLIVKGGSFTDVMDNLFDTILTGVINSGLNSLIGGLTQGLFAPQHKQSSGGSGLFGFLGNIFGGGGIGSLLGGLFSAGGMIPNYANGGLMEAIATSAIRERQQSGKQPRLIMGHVGELLINADRVKELKNLGVTTQLLLGKANYADGGMVDSESFPSREYGRGIGTANGRKNELTIHYQSKQIAGENYVTEDQFQQGLRKAAEEGGKRGAQIVTNKLGNSPGYRRSVGL